MKCLHQISLFRTQGTQKKLKQLVRQDMHDIRRTRPSKTAEQSSYKHREQSRNQRVIGLGIRCAFGLGKDLYLS